MDSRELLTYSSEYGIDLILDQAEILLAYMRRLLEVNQVLNLTAITDEDEFIDKHLVDSLFLKLPEAGQPFRCGYRRRFSGDPPCNPLSSASFRAHGRYPKEIDGGGKDGR